MRDVVNILGLDADEGGKRNGRFGLHVCSNSTDTPEAWESLFQSNQPFEAHEHHHHDPNRHDAAIRAFCVTLDQPLDWPAMAMWLEMLVASRGENLLRVKGILNLKGHDRPVAIHAVRHLMHPPAKLAAWPEGDPRTSRLVFITRDLPRSVIEEGLRAFQAAGG